MTGRGEAYYSGSAEYLAALEARERAPAVAAKPAAGPAVTDWALLQCNTGQVGVLQLINAYRFHGFRAADLDPLKRLNQDALPELDPANYGLTPADLELEFDTGSLAGPPRDSLRGILARLRRAYCGTLSAEYMHIRDTPQKRWLQARLESDELEREVSDERRHWLLKQLTLAETVEKLIHARFVGQKRFSLEGAESLIPLLNFLAERAIGGGIKEIGLGMAHRGRLNVLHNVLGRSALALFAEEANLVSEGASTGDVKYHLGYAREVETAAGGIRIALAFNPSHLEIVNPAVQGWVRAQQQKRGDLDGSQVVPVLIHGDAAFAGQGVVMESLAMSATRGFTTGGTLHIIVNNQIGFTTSDPRDTRSSLYCTDVMKMVEAPVLHVNGDDPEAVLKAVRIALDYRMTFRHDIAIDLICYRRLGHNEQDEPMVTQPLMYRRIRDLAGTRALYAQSLQDRGLLGEGAADALVEACKQEIEALPAAPERPYTPYVADWRPYRGNDWRAPADTAVPAARLRELGQRIAHEPAGFSLHPRVIMVMQSRRQMAEGALPLDWGMAEALAFASLLTEGHGIRLSGQDSGRGTFFHRHAVLHDQQRERWDAGVHIPLQNLGAEQAHFLVVDSLLSEEAVLSFEYGYASAAPNELAIWEAQFGDFANGAQVVIDQFIAAGEAKWGRLNGLVLYLPHGYEGQGPEHSSARIERYLQLAAEDNIQVVQPSLPGQLFHLLRRQIRRPYRKPLICFTPKSLLRHPDSSSSLEDLASGAFQPVLGEADDGIEPAKVARLVFCSGRVYFDLAQARKARGLDHVAILRVEQYYPLPDAELRAELARYPNAAEIVWAQDEPQNQGAWRYMAYHLRALSGQSVRYAGRPASASPATGYHGVHKKQLDELIAAALGAA
ncbi:MAG: 2-oxoglutarate dehydrogenase E1 component [Betaproteobacteria bacterium]|nr:2-oxoglutarate dehydrogenase E1 component [Betaproteobacteria bacterium]